MKWWICHFFLDGLQVFHCIDSVTDFLADLIVEKANVCDAMHALQATWFAIFRFSEQMQGDKAFASKSFLAYLKFHDIVFRLAPVEDTVTMWLGVRTQSLEAILCLSDADGEKFDDCAETIRAISVSNDIMGMIRFPLSS